MRSLPSHYFHLRPDCADLSSPAVKPDKLILALPVTLPDQHAIVRGGKRYAEDCGSVSRLGEGNWIALQFQMVGVEPLRQQRPITHKEQPVRRRIHGGSGISQQLLYFFGIERSSEDSPPLSTNSVEKGAAPPPETKRIGNGGSPCPTHA